MTDSLLRTPYRLPDPPISDGLSRQTWDSYRRSLETIAAMPNGVERLTSLLTEVNAKLEAEARSTISSTLSAHASTQDTLVPRSMAKAVRSPTERGPERGQSRPPAAWELLSSSQRLGPRLAQKLTLAAARKAAR